MEIDYTDLQKHLDVVWNKFYDWQKDVVTRLSANLKTALDAAGGTGKTLMALYPTMQLRPKRVLIVCSNNAVWTWIKEITEYFKPWANILHISGSAAQRRKLWTSPSLFKICSSSTLRTDRLLIDAWGPEVVICDEYHKVGLKNRASQATAAFKYICQKAKAYFETSGSGLRKGPQDIWSVLNINAPKKFASYWAFINRYCVIIENTFGKEIGPAKNSERMVEEIADQYIRIPRSISDAAKPKLVRQIIPVEMSKLQKRYYRELADDMFTQIETEGGDIDLIHSSTTVGVIVKLRKLCICPQMLGIPDVGPAIDMVLEHIEEVGDPHCVIFTPFTDAIPIFKEYLTKKLPDVTVYTLQGGAKPDDIANIEKGFRASRNTICIVSSHYAQSFELESAQYCHHLGYDWDQNTNEQCEWRLQRITADKTKPIHSYYYQFIGTMDEVIMYTLNVNTLNVKNTFKSVDQLYNFLSGKMEAQ